MRHALHVAPAAASQIREAADWWWANRPKAQRAFREDLEKTFDLISSLPWAGQKVSHARINGLRRVLMGRVRYYVYYQVDTGQAFVKVLALWHASRHDRPHLR